ncbi:MAG: hypothetical protein ACRENE_16715 [Polyangiaceae bacterium]
MSKAAGSGERAPTLAAARRMMQPGDMTQAGAKGPAVPPKAPAVPARGTSPAAPAVAPRATQTHTAPKPATSGASGGAPGTAPIAPKKGPPRLPGDSAPDLGTAPVPPMRPRFETSPGMGHSGAGASPPPGESPRAPVVQSREDVESMIRKASADVVVTVLGEARSLIATLERRVDELERRLVLAAMAPAAQPAAQSAAHAMAPAAPPATYAAPSQAAAQAPAVHVAPAPPVMARTQPLAPVSAIPITYSRPPMLDVRAIERDTSIDVDSALDGSKRKRNLGIIVTILILAVFGGLFAMLAQSYAPHH